MNFLCNRGGKSRKNHTQALFQSLPYQPSLQNQPEHPNRTPRGGGTATHTPPPQGPRRDLSGVSPGFVYITCHAEVPARPFLTSRVYVCFKIYGLSFGCNEYVFWVYRLSIDLFERYNYFLEVLYRCSFDIPYNAIWSWELMNWCHKIAVYSP